MRSLVAILCLTLLAVADDKPRKSSPIAPSLPELTKDEERKIDDIVDRLIDADTGKLRGPDAKKAFKDFDALKHEAIPSMIRGLNKAAEINHSCPVLLIGKKLSSLLGSSEDEQLLQFARDEIGAGVKKTPHTRVLQDLRVRIMLRQNVLAARPAIPPKGVTSMTTAELNRAVGKVKGEQLREVLGELAKRPDKDALRGIVATAGSLDRDRAQTGRELLDEALAKLTRSVLEQKLGEDNLEVRRSILRIGASVDIELVPAIIDRLTDTHPAIRAEARAAMVKLSKDQDFGPEPKATKAQQEEAKKAWKAWWFKKTAEK